MKSLIKDLIISVIFLGVAAGAGLLFYLDWTTEPEYRGGQIVGEIADLNNNAIRVPGDRAREFTIENKGDVFLYETIKVNSKSGSRLEIVLSEEYYENTATLVLYENSQIKFTPVGFRTAGRIAIIEQNGETKDIEGSFEAVVDDKGLDIQIIRVEPLAPIARNYVTLGKTASVAFSWNELAEVRDKEIQISRTRDFQQVLYSSPVIDDNQSGTANIPPGTWFWRLKGIDDEGREYYGSENFFSIYKYRPSELKDPVKSKNIRYFNKISVSLSWDEASFTNGDKDYKADFYQLEVSSNGQFNDIKPIILGQKTRYRLTEDVLPGEGDYTWRITPGFYFLQDMSDPRPFQRILTSELQSEVFRLRKQEDQPPLDILFPENDSEYNVVEVENGLTFKWERDPELENYRFEVARSRNFDSIVYSSITDFNSLNLSDDLRPGNYWWRVWGLVPGADDRNSAIGSFTVTRLEGNIQLVYPADGETLQMEDNTERITFRWESNYPEAEYRIYLFEDGEEAPINQQFTRDNSQQWLLEADKQYQWQAVLLDKSGRKVSTSPIRNFSTAAPFTAPKILIPRDGERLSFFGEDSYSFQWAAVDKAETYMIRVSRADDSKTVFQEVTDSTRFVLQDLSLLEEGEYRVSLQGFRSDAPPGAPRETTRSLSGFTVENLVLYSAAEPRSPRNGFDQDLLYVKRNGLSFRWEQDPPMKSFIVDIYKDGNPVPFQTVQTKEMGFQIDEVPEGSYTWYIRSFDDKGNEVPRSSVNGFIVRPVPALKRSRIVEPGDGSTLDMQTRDSIEFKWEEVPGSEYYNILFFDVKNNREILRKKVDSAVYSFTELEKLDVGTFYFEVEAIKENREYGIGFTQKSPVQRSTFSIYLEGVYEIPNIISPDTQYTR